MNIGAVWKTDNVRSSCDIPSDRGILGHFFHHHTFKIACTPGRKKDLFSLDPAQFDKRSKKVRVGWCIKMLEKYDGVASKKSNMRVFERDPYPTKVVCGKITKQMVAC